jgi:hypothetical protein
MKQFAPPMIILVLLALSLGLFLMYSNKPQCEKKTIVVTPLKDYEYSFTVDGTDSTLLYTIYDFEHNVIAEDITANKLDSVINCDNE